jgi:thioredoxin-like negative regulator of GroEL
MRPGRVASRLASMFRPILSASPATFAERVLRASVPVLVDFGSSASVVSRAMQPILAQFATERTDVRVVQVDAAAHPDLAAEHGVQTLPTLVLFAAGRALAHLAGGRARMPLEAEVDRALAAGPII